MFLNYASTPRFQITERRRAVLVVSHGRWLQLFSSMFKIGIVGVSAWFVIRMYGGDSEWGKLINLLVAKVPIPLLILFAVIAILTLVTEGVFVAKSIVGYEFEFDAFSRTIRRRGKTIASFDDVHCIRVRLARWGNDNTIEVQLEGQRAATVVCNRNLRRILDAADQIAGLMGVTVERV